MVTHTLVSLDPLSWDTEVESFCFLEDAGLCVVEVGSNGNFP